MTKKNPHFNPWFYWLLVAFQSRSHVLLAVVHSSTLHGHILMAFGLASESVAAVFYWL